MVLWELYLLVMSVEQQSLSDIDRGGSQTTKNVRGLLSGPGIQGIVPRAKSDYADLYREWCDDVADDFYGMKESLDLAQRIVDGESPVLRDYDNGDVDVFCFGESPVDELLTVVSDDRFDLEKIVIPSIASIGSDPRAVAERLRELAGIDVDVMLRSGSESSWVRVNAANEREFEAVLNGMCLTDCYSLTKSREATKNDIRRWSDWDMKGGRAPLGFEWVAGELVPGDDYRDVCACLELVRDGEMSKNKAAAHLDTSSRTITRSIGERSARYGV